jgi:hypothetical protein
MKWTESTSTRADADPNSGWCKHLRVYHELTLILSSWWKAVPLLSATQGPSETEGRAVRQGTLRGPRTVLYDGLTLSLFGHSVSHSGAS